MQINITLNFKLEYIYYLPKLVK